MSTDRSHELTSIGLGVLAIVGIYQIARAWGDWPDTLGWAAVTVVAAVVAIDVLRRGRRSTRDDAH